MPSIVSIAYSSAALNQRPDDCYHRAVFGTADLVADRGIEGDRKGKGGSRQLNLMSAEMLARLHDEGFKTAPGEMGEQIVIAGIVLEGLPQGTQLRLGRSAIVEVNIPRTGCSRFEHIQAKFKGLARGRLGVMARVVASGPIAVGDDVIVLPRNGDSS